MHVDNTDQSGERRLQLSLIIPIYNGQSYIASLLQEITSQKVSNMEVIFIDDGSTDDSSTVIEAEIGKTGAQVTTASLAGDIDKREVVMVSIDDSITYRLICQENRGQGGARNTGLAAARGAWVMFCDQDDYMRQDYLRTMLESAEAADCDILISGYDTVREDGSVIQHVPLQNTSWSRFMNVTPWGKVYRTSFLREHGIRFYETPYGEDIYLMLLCEAAHARVCITSYVGYQWVQNMASVSHTTHRTLDRNASALSLIHKAVTEIPGLDLRDSELQYFFLKTAIYHVLYIAGSTEHRALLEYNNDLFAELQIVCPRILYGPLVRPWRPTGERGVVRVVVWIYAILRRMRLDGVLLQVYARGVQ